MGCKSSKETLPFLDTHQGGNYDKTHRPQSRKKGYKGRDSVNPSDSCSNTSICTEGASGSGHSGNSGLGGGNESGRSRNGRSRKDVIDEDDERDDGGGGRYCPTS